MKLTEKDINKLKKTSKNVTQNKNTATHFLKSCGIMNENGQLSEEYKN